MAMKKSGRNPLEPLFQPKSKSKSGSGAKKQKPAYGPSRAKRPQRPTFGAVPMPRKRIPDSVTPSPTVKRPGPKPMPREMPKRVPGKVQKPYKPGTKSPSKTVKPAYRKRIKGMEK